ncbi:MAG: DNA methyltransferase [Planctomycetota bacterium]
MDAAKPATTIPRVTPQQFVSKWSKADLSERSAYQQHFLDLCDLLAQPKPADADPDGAWYTFERGVRKTTGGDGWADVWMRGHFGWEYKGKHKNLGAAYQQLNLYREALENPPLLVVCDLDRIEIHTNFTGTVTKVYAFDLQGLSEPANLEVLDKLFTDPNSLRPDQTAVGVTEAAAGQFGQLADGLRQRGVPAGKAAHFLMKLMFCFFAEDVGLLPKDLFSGLLTKCQSDPKRLSKLLRDLFAAMMKGGDFGADTIAHFNGGLFADADVVDLRTHEIEQLITVAGFDWSGVEPSVFGTLFERTLDPDKRAQIGAQYTSKVDILTLVEPVLMKPLRREWASVREKCDELWAGVQQESRKGKGARGLSKKESGAKKKHDTLIQGFVERLGHVQILDPACGSGNFLYVAIQLLLDLEKQVIAFAADRRLGLVPHVRPTQLHGLESLSYAHQLAQVVIWIGYLQWMRQNGFSPPRDPILEPIESIKQMDAILDISDLKSQKEPSWPEADVIIGNPPFLGGKLLRTHLGDDYVDKLFRVWDDRVPREGDLCCYWFEKARAMIVSGRAKRVGLLATQGIRGGANREVLKRIKQSGDIFFAVSDRDWILDGANVHVSMIGFDDGAEAERTLDARAVAEINPDLTTEADTTDAKKIQENLGIAFQGTIKDGPFEIDAGTAQGMLQSPNVHRRSNREVVRPWVNGSHLTGRLEGMWIVDFGAAMTLEQAALYEAPFRYVLEKVKPLREKNRDRGARERWWLHIRPRPEMREAIRAIARVICTPRVSKHRVFVWLESGTLADSATYVFARDDDYFFGVLHSAIHERWSRRMGTQLREAESGCRYTPTTCFETFPFPPLSGGVAKDPPQSPLGKGGGHLPPSPLGKRGQRGVRDRIAQAARKLCELRDQWLNPTFAGGGPMLTETQLKKRTLTNLYNERPTWLELGHLELDRAVLAGYGWPEEWAEGLQPKRDAKGKVNPILGVVDGAVEQEVLSGLLELNLRMSAAAD